MKLNIKVNLETGLSLGIFCKTYIRDKKYCWQSVTKTNKKKEKKWFIAIYKQLHYNLYNAKVHYFMYIYHNGRHYFVC